MTDYGVQPTGYVRKPLSIILAELEAAMITEFGPGVIQTAQSPLGQINGLMADLVAEIDEHNLDIYQSYDPDQAEGNRLDILARVRLQDRGYQSDQEFRLAITNQGQARVDVQDLRLGILGIDGVTFCQVFVNETGEVSPEGLDTGTVAVAVIGGDDQAIAEAMRQYIVPGVVTYGNERVTTNKSGYCRSMSIIRPIDITVNVDVKVEVRDDRYGCPAPSMAAIKATIEEGWAETRINGLDPSFYSIRTLVESAFPNVEVISINGERDGVEFGTNADVIIGFVEIATVVATVSLV